MQRNSIGQESKAISNTNDDDTQAPPPSYPSIIYKLPSYPSSAEYNNHSLPPSYSDINSPVVVYINNYPGPPLTDGIVRVTTPDHSGGDQMPTIGTLLSKRIRIYLAVNGVITICFGLLVVGLQIGLLESHTIVLYYYGFWAGALLICIGISTIMLNSHYQSYNLEKLFGCFRWHVLFLAIIFGFGLTILLTESCDHQTSTDENGCTSAYEILSELLISIVALTFAQAIINTIVLGVLKRRSVVNLHSVHS